ncbi:MAG: hypothetical protein LUI39_01500 [Lachnospiraceae bacterium]|nr:hypothetical protein [Lachnospiraceae bacterium]
MIKDFRRKVNKRGGKYGMPVCVYTKPEDLWGYDMVSANYKEESSESRQKIYEHLSHNYPFASGEQLNKLLK